MSNFNRGDKVIATLPNGYKSNEMFVTDSNPSFTTCANVDDQKRLFTATVPTAWLEKKKTLDELIAGKGPFPH